MADKGKIKKSMIIALLIIFASTLANCTVFPEIKNPQAKIFMDMKFGYQMQTITFDGSKSTDPNGNIVLFHWDFGDGCVSLSSITTHKFREVHNYTITLTITNDKGAETSKSVSLEIKNAIQLRLENISQNQSNGWDITITLYNSGGEKAPTNDSSFSPAIYWRLKTKQGNDYYCQKPNGPEYIPPNGQGTFTCNFVYPNSENADFVYYDSPPYLSQVQVE